MKEFAINASIGVAVGLLMGVVIPLLPHNDTTMLCMFLCGMFFAAFVVIIHRWRADRKAKS